MNYDGNGETIEIKLSCRLKGDIQYIPTTVNFKRTNIIMLSSSREEYYCVTFCTR
jgi:hypothetical protein